MPAQQHLDNTPVTAIKGVGPQVAQKLERLGLFTVQDLLFHLPYRYQDRTRLTPLGALQLHSDVLIEGEIRASQIVFGRRRSLVCRLQDNTGTVTLRFFHFGAAQKNQLVAGTRLRCFGETRRGASGLELYHPEYTVIDTATDNKLALEANLTPVYPATEGIQQQRLRNIITQALNLLNDNNLSDLLRNLPLPQHFPESFKLRETLAYLHRPPLNAPLHQLAAGEHPLQQRLAFEELLAHHLSLLKSRQQLKQQNAPALPLNSSKQNALLENLPFALTGAQQRVAAEIAEDIAQPHPMLRLVQGDVGSGKTVVAALAAVQAIANGKQVALMAPTEILAEQHYNNFRQWLEPLDIQVGWLTGSLKVKERREQLQATADGRNQIIIGTHALFQDGVDYCDLGLVIIDEQHRFGVQQRYALTAKAQQNQQPHQLIMTATPIPRTLAMSFYADLDSSVIDELPPGRTPVNTVLIENGRRDQVIERVRAACLERKQAYWVCTLIEESEELQCEAAESSAQMLAEALPGISIGLVHGRLKAKDKAMVMDAFKAGNIDLLVATTVIEVGVDVPNASLMIIENPERLGLSQLHQLRGRIGRGSLESHCVLLYSTPLSKDSKERLAVMRETSDGFIIAEKDLQLRGPGEVLGTRQTGDIQFHIADLQRDAHLLNDIKSAAAHLQQQPQQIQALIDRWLGINEQYAKV